MNSIDYFGLTTTEKKGYLLPDLYLAEIEKKFKPNVFGAVRPHKDGGFELFMSAENVDFKKIRAASKKFADEPVMWYFGNYPKDFKVDSIQPYLMILDDQHKNNVAVTLCGDFSAHEEKEAKYSPEWWCAHKRLMPKLQMIFRLCKQDINMFFLELQSPQMQQEVKDLIGPQGGMIEIAVVNKDGAQIAFYGKSMPTFKEFNWGSTTDVLGYVSGIVEPEPKAEEKKPERKVSKLPELEVVEEDDEDEDKEIPPVITPKSEPTDKTTIVKEKEVVQEDGTIVRLTYVDEKQVVLVYPPNGITQRRAVKRWARNKIGRDITNKEADARIGLMPSAKDQDKFLKLFTKTFHSLQEAAEHLKSPDPGTGTTEKAIAKDTVTGKDVAVTVAEDKKYPEGGSPIYSVLANKTKYDLNKYLKTLDKGGQRVPPPTMGQEMENTTRQFFKDIGYPSLEETLGWEPDVRYEIAKKFPDAMVIWTGDLLRLIANQKKEIEALAFDPAISKEEEVEEIVLPKRKTA